MIYFVQDEQFIKIGHTEAGDFRKSWWPDDVRTRMGHFLSGNPRDVILLGVIQGSRNREYRLHRIFADDHHKGEWFHASARLLEFIKRHAVQLPPKRKKKIGYRYV